MNLNSLWCRSRADQREVVDVLYVSMGTTAGLRRADATFIDAARQLGVTVASVSFESRLPWRVRSFVWRSLLAIDVFESASVAVTVRTALRRYRPRSLVYGTSHAALLRLHRSPWPVAIRFDTPASMSRSRPRFVAEHLLERRWFKRARILLPWGVTVNPAVAAQLPAAVATVPLPIPVAPDQAVATQVRRADLVVAYGANPHKKGLDEILRAWTNIEPVGARLVVTGLDRSAGRAYLNSIGLDEPVNVEWAGRMSSGEHRKLIRAAGVYLAASRYEDYGIAQLEALADGALLVTTQSPGPYAALAIAHELDPSLVATAADSLSLTRALNRALAYSGAERASYQSRAAQAIRGHSEHELLRRLHDRVLPILLNGYPDHR